MKEIDLGEGSKYNVKFNGQVYPLREPTVKDAKFFQAKQAESNKGDEMSPFIEFLSELGMPKDVAESLPLSKLQLLTNGIMGDLEKK